MGTERSRTPLQQNGGVIKKTRLAGGDREVTAAPTRDGQRDASFRVLIPLLEPLARALGKRAEVVLHDFRFPDHSIIGIVGDVTGRHAGGSMSQIGLAILREGDDAKPQYEYVTRSPNGRVLRSTTVPLRDDDGHVFGALCVNVDVTEMWDLSTKLNEELGVEEQPPGAVTFVDDVNLVVNELIREEALRFNCAIERLEKDERLELIRALDKRGAFTLQRSVPEVARRLGLSRASLYSYLKEVRET